MLKYIFSLTSILGWAMCSLAQMDKIDTDRPDQTESPFIVPKKWIQLEMGMTKETDQFTSGANHNYFFHHPTLLTKYGLIQQMELRLITELSTLKEKDVSGWHQPTGFSAIEIGGKLHLLKEMKWRPEISIIAHYELAHARTLYYDSVDGANFRFTMQHTLSPTISLGYNAGMRWERFGSPPSFVYTCASGFNISEKWYAYIEVFGSFLKNEIPANSFDGGIAYYINHNFKIDISGGLGISKEAPDNYFAIGASFRFTTIK